MTVRARAMALLLPLLVAGCSTPDFLCLAPSSVGVATIETSADANRGTAVAIDIVYARASDVAAKLREMPAAAWFAGRDQLQRDYLDDLAVRSWELGPGQTVRAQRLDPPCSVDAALAYVRLATPGDHRLNLAGIRHARLAVTRDAVTLVPET